MSEHGKDEDVSSTLVALGELKVEIRHLTGRIEALIEHVERVDRMAGTNNGALLKVDGRLALLEKQVESNTKWREDLPTRIGKWIVICGAVVGFLAWFNSVSP